MKPPVFLSLCLVALAGLSWAHDEDHVEQVATGHRRSGLHDGASCNNNDECVSKCCLKIFHGDGSGSPGQCHVAAGPGEHCSLEQVKGGANVNHCPCRVGTCGDDNICPNSDNSPEDDHDD